MKTKPAILSRRHFLRATAGGLALAAITPLSFPARTESADTAVHQQFKTRGVVLVPEDLSLADWPERAKKAGLTTLALHHGVWPRAVVKLIESDQGRKFLEKCRQLGLQVEYELHALKELLPRDLFLKDKTLFRMNDQGERVADCNLCVHSPQALEIAGENALQIAKVLHPTTGRYFFWGDDGEPWCRCGKCCDLSDSDQALLLENHLANVLRRQDSRAQVAHLAYANTIRPPRQIKALPQVFLEFAPIHRRYDVPYEQQTQAQDKDGLPALDANLKVFSSDSAQVLEYWLDVSRASGWKRPGVQLPWHNEVFLSDVTTYRSRHIGHITTFAAWIDFDYVKRYGEPAFLKEYGDGLLKQEGRGN